MKILKDLDRLCSFLCNESQEKNLPKSNPNYIFNEKKSEFLRRTDLLISSLDSGISKRLKDEKYMDF